MKNWFVYLGKEHYLVAADAISVVNQNVVFKSAGRIVAVAPPQAFVMESVEEEPEPKL